MNSEALQEQLRDGDRLDGWKRIANYLECDVRTAKRWENDRRLPIHRHHHSKRATIYAFVDELEAWKAGETPASAEPQAERRTSWLVAGVVGASIAAVGGSVAWLASSGSEPSLEGDSPIDPSPLFPTIVMTGLEQQWTDNDWNDWGVRSDGKNFVWRADMPTSTEIFARIDGQIFQITDDNRDQVSPGIDGTRIAWVEGPDCFGEGHEDGWDCEVWIYADGEATQLTDDRASEGGPVGRDGAFVWERNDPALSSNLDVYVHRNGQLSRITGDPSWDWNPVVSGNRIVWESITEDFWELFEYDGEKITQLTNNKVKDRQPSIDGSWTAWVRFDGQDDEIFFSDGTDEWQLSNNSGIGDVKPQMLNGRVAWVAKTNPLDGDGNEIMAFDGTNIYQLTDDNVMDWNPWISDEYIVWHRAVGPDSEIVAVAWADLEADRLAMKGTP